MATRENTDFLRFNAFAIKDLIIRKLAQDSNYTDQIYPGSNLNILIDIISYMYQTLMFNLNSAAAESMWSDTNIYENINRLSQFLGYNPHGMNPASAIFSFPLDQFKELSLGNTPTIPRYSYIDTGKIDTNGNKVYYSTVEDIIIHPTSQSIQNITLYNGRWRLYNNVFVAEGTDWETFVLNGLRSDSYTNDYVANNYIHVYVAEPIENGVTKFQRYNMTDGGLFKSRNEFFSSDGNAEQNGGIPIPRIYSPNDYVFNLRLDETKTYTITFGNNRQGHRLTKGSSIYIFYLDSNAPGSELELNEVNGTLNQDLNSFQYSSDGKNYANIYRQILGVDSGSTIGYIFTGVRDVNNISQTISFTPEESVNQIRDFAPNWFKMGNRLVTQSDYEYYLNNSPAFRDTFIDVKCQNNWGYMSTFYKWLYEMGCKYKNEINPEDEFGGRRFLRQDNILKTERQYADPSDSNNIYLWIVPNSFGGIDQLDMSVWKKSASTDWKNALMPIKDLTHEPYFIPAVLTKFAICAANDYSYVRDNYIKGDINSSNIYNENYIEITIADEIIYANSSIQNQIKTIIYNFFRSENFKLGQYVDFNDLQNQILSINGVNRIRTIFKPIDNKMQTVVRNGLSFASWTDDPILQIRNRTEGIDLDISSAGRTLEQFQFPQFVTSINNINVVVIKRSVSSLNTTAY